MNNVLTKKKKHIKREPFSKVWQGLAPPKAELLTWFVLLGRLNIKDRFCRLNILIGSDDKCIFCNEHCETLNHLFLSCYFSWRVWNVVVDQWGYYIALPNDPVLAFDSWLGVRYRRSLRKQWIIWFFTLIWSLWDLRNRVIFQNGAVLLEPFILQVLDRGRTWKKAIQ